MRPTIADLSPIHGVVLPSEVVKLDENLKRFDFQKVRDMRDFEEINKEFRKIGMDISPRHVEQMVAMDAAMNIQYSKTKKSDTMADFTAMDALQQSNLTPTIPGLAQFLQNWIPGEVYELTARRLIDEFLGFITAGDWEDEQIVQKVVELKGLAVPYGDYQNIPLVSWAVNFNYTTVVRFEIGTRVYELESARAAKVGLSADNLTNQSSNLQLNVALNNTGWSGYNGGANNTYGFLNAPGLPAYVTATTKAGSGTTWAVGTYLEIIQDLINMFTGIQSGSQENIDPKRVPTTLGLATNVINQLSKVSNLGTGSVYTWLKENYPLCRVISAPQLNNANGGANVGYLWADTTNPDDFSTDGKAIFGQYIPARYKSLGVKQDITFYTRGASCATAGVMCKRPFGVYRITGI